MTQRSDHERSAGWANALEWRIAWRHLRVGERHPRWVDLLSAVSLFMLAVGAGFVLWAAHLGPTPGPDEQLFSAAIATPQQRNFGVFGGLSVAIGAMLLVLALLARFFNLLATIITMSVLLGVMALVVVLSLMSGLEADLRDKILDQKAHLRISESEGNRFADYHELVDALTAVPGIAGASPYVEAEIMVRSGINRQGAVLLGVEPERLLQVSNIAEIMSEGSFESLTHPETIPDPDPFATTQDTPWRLRHLDKNKDGDTDKASPFPPGSTIEPKRIPPLPDLADLPERKDEPGDDEPQPRVSPGIGGNSLGADPIRNLNNGRLPPPPAELFGSDSLGNFGNFGPAPQLDDDGWEDPVEVLGLKKDSPPEPVSAPSKRTPELPEGEDWGSDDGWEDPVAVLDLPPESAMDPAEPPNGAQGEPPAGEPPSGDGLDKEPAIELAIEPPRTEGVLDPILIGRELANELAVGVGTRVQLITPVGRLTPAGRVPGILAAKVGGVFYSGMYEYDRKNVYAPLSVAQAFLRTSDRISGIEVKLDDIEQVDAGQIAVEAELRRLGRSTPPLQRTVRQLINAISDETLRAEVAARHGIDLGESELIVESWKELNRNLFSAMFLEKIAMFVALLFVVLVASFGILASNLMSVLEKSKEIAILKAMGGPDQLIQRVFVSEGLCLGLLGALGGISMGLGLCFALDRFGFPFNENVYYIERLPVVINPFEVAVVGVAALVIVFLSSLYPARVASRMRPVDGLRHQEK
jgi:ABC-type lipoprotein release transport system permease subunit